METADAILLRRWREGDLAAGEALFERYYGRIERFFINKVSTGVGDLVQETFTALVENRDRLNEDSKLGSYLFAIAYNVLCGHLRHTYRSGQQIEFDRVSTYDLSPSPSSVAVRRREERLLLEALRSIPLDYQMILELHYWEDMKTADIAAVLGIPAGTVRSRMRRARELLQDSMEALARSPEILESTRMQLADWARKCREQLDQLT